MMALSTEELAQKYVAGTLTDAELEASGFTMNEVASIAEAIKSAGIPNNSESVLSFGEPFKMDTSPIKFEVDDVNLHDSMGNLHSVSKED